MKDSIITFFKKPIVKHVVSAIAVAGFGFILLNLTFLFDALFQNFINKIVRMFTLVNSDMAWNWFPPLKHFAFLIVILLISWFIFMSKFRTLYKAIFMTVPLAWIYGTIAILLYRWPIIVYSIGVLFSIGVLCYFYRTKKPWLYYYTLILVGIAMLVLGLSGTEI